LTSFIKDHTSWDNWDTDKAFFGESLKKFGKPIEKSKFENLVTLLQLTPLVGFLAMTEKICSTRENFP
jgi:hypothetical protein